MSFDTRTETASLILDRELKVTTSDRNVYWDEREIAGARISIEIGTVVRVETDKGYITEHLDGTKAELQLTAGEIDHLIEKLVLTKSLIGSDFLVYGHTDNYTKDGKYYTKDGVEITK